MVSFILVNNSISRGQLQYTDYLIYTNNSHDVNAETLQSSEKGHIKISNTFILLELKCFNLLMVVSGGLCRTTSNQVGCWQPELGRNYCLQLIQG